jgi:hypothetical protein
MTEFVCPQPGTWHKIHTALREAWEQAGSKGSAPPTPLILNGWMFSDDRGKKVRWDQTLAWAKSQELEFLIPALTPDMAYRVDEIREFVRLDPIGRLNEEPREVPDNEAVGAAMDILRRDWKKIAGDSLAAATAPVRISGLKKRRLLVLADYSTTPPWGSWTSLVSVGQKRRENFTRLRVAINTAIAPLYVDHVDFEATQSDQLEEHDC